MGCDDGRESFPGPFAENGEEERDEVERRTKRGEKWDDPEDNDVEGGQGG